MAKFCSECGTQIRDDARFCPNCGKAAVQPAPQQPKCAYCGAELKETSKFCPKCGRSVSSVTIQQTPPVPQPVPQESQPLRQVTQQLQALGINVPASPTQGAAAIDIPNLSGMADSVGTVSEIVSPFATAINGIKGFFTGFKHLGKDKKALIGAVIMAVLWTVIWLWNRSDGKNIISEILSAITFAEGGTRGNAAQFIGGIFGKGMVMSCFASLFAGGIPGIIGGVKKIFGKGLHIGSCIMGFGIAVTLYQLFAGFTGTYGIAVALSGAALSLQALGGNSGFFNTFAESLASRRLGQMRTANDTRCKSILTGLTAGFTLSAALSAFYIPWWIGAIVILIGFIVGLIVKGREAVR